MDPTTTPPIEPSIEVEIWEILDKAIVVGDKDRITAVYQSTASSDMARAISLLSESKRGDLFRLLDPDIAADLAEELAHPQTADILGELEATEAAAILGEMDSDEQADVLAELDDDDAHAILEAMAPEEALEARSLASYPSDTAGGLMITEALAFRESQVIDEVIQDLRAHRDEYAEYDVQYIYVLADDSDQLRGVVRLRDVLMGRGDRKIIDILFGEALSVSVTDALEALEDFFDRYAYNAAPVVDDQRRFLGVVRRSDVEEAHGEKAEEDLLRIGGIITGEELRTMGVGVRAARRMMYLVPTLLLALGAVSVIAMNEEIVEEVPALAIFLPLIAGVCGSAGNQAVAVSMRELSLGLVKAGDVSRVLVKELAVGLITGVMLGLMIYVIARVIRSDTPELGIVVGAAVPMTILVAVAVGGTVPLILRGLKIDPAMASGPILAMLTDLTGFFLTLQLALWLLIKH